MAVRINVHHHLAACLAKRKGIHADAVESYHVSLHLLHAPRQGLERMDADPRENLRARDRELPYVCADINYRLRNDPLPLEGRHHAMRRQREL